MKKWLLVGFSLLLSLAFVLPSRAYQALRLDGNGYASVADASQAGLDMGLSDFILEMRVKIPSAPGVSAYIVSKGTGDTNRYSLFIPPNIGILASRIYDSDGGRLCTYDGASICDGRWHDISVVFDRSGNMTRYVDGVAYGTADDISGLPGNTDCAENFFIGAYESSYLLLAQFDEVRIWNFGLNGLPADYAAYITWRAAARNVFLDISSYNAGSWNGYADADRSELTTNGDMEADSTWAARGSPTTEERSTDQKNGGSYSWKIISDAAAEGAYQDITTVVGEYYEVTGYVYVTAGDAKLGKEDTDGSDQVLTGQATAAAWAEFNVVFLATETTSRIFFQSDATAASTFYVDDVSVKRTGLTARYKFEGDYTDETSNSNDLSAGGTGNVFPDYTLKKQKIISPFSVK